MLADIAGRLGAALEAGAIHDDAAAGVRHTTLGVIATDAVLTKAQCTKLAAIAHDGLARAVNPVHTLFDGDLFFGVSTATGPAPDATGPVHAAGRGCRRGDPGDGTGGAGRVVGDHPGRQLAAYRDLAPSALHESGAAGTG